MKHIADNCFSALASVFLRRPPSAKRGFSLIEASVLIAIFGVAILFAMRMYEPSARYNLVERRSEELSRAMDRMVERISQDFEMPVLAGNVVTATYRNGTNITGTGGDIFKVQTGYSVQSICWNKASNLNVYLCRNRACENEGVEIVKNVALFVSRGDFATENDPNEAGKRRIKVESNSTQDVSVMTHNQLRNKLECSNSTILPRDMDIITAMNGSTSFYAAQGMAGFANWTFATSNGWPLYWCVTFDKSREGTVYGHGRNPMTQRQRNIIGGSSTVSETTYPNCTAQCLSPNEESQACLDCQAQGGGVNTTNRAYTQYLYGGDAFSSCQFPQSGPTTWKITMPGEPEPSTNLNCAPAYSGSHGDEVFNRIVTRDQYPALSNAEYNKFCERLGANTPEAKTLRDNHLFYGDRFNIFVNLNTGSYYPNNRAYALGAGSFGAGYSGTSPGGLFLGSKSEADSNYLASGIYPTYYSATEGYIDYVSIKSLEMRKQLAARGTYHVNAYVSDDPEFRNIIDKVTIILKN